MLKSPKARSRNNTLALMIVALLCFSSSGRAGELTIDFALPTIDTADYNKPYVAMWLESADTKETLLLWHLHERDEDKWLSDIRRWWRKIGRYGLPADAVTGATRGPGRYRESFQLDTTSPATLFIEVVREDGGRSLLQQPLAFSDTEQVIQLPADREIGQTIITLGAN